MRGPIRYEHDALGNLVAATQADQDTELRLSGRGRQSVPVEQSCGPKIWSSGTASGISGRQRCRDPVRVDPEGNLLRKIELPAGNGSARVWSYTWNGAGMLASVVRPDRDQVRFEYDGLSRRLSKTFRDRTTRWIWDGNVPLHEWIDHRTTGRPTSASSPMEQRTTRQARFTPPGVLSIDLRKVRRSPLAPRSAYHVDIRSGELCPRRPARRRHALFHRQ